MTQVEQFDVIVVGGGPAGAAVARDIAGAGFEVLVIERDPHVGKPIQCSGLVTERTLAAARLDPAMASNALTGAVVYAPSGTRYEIGGDRAHAYILDRSRFDQGVMSQALEVGVHLRTHTRVLGIERAENLVHVRAEREGKHEGFKAPLIIGADGPRSIVADFLGLPPPSEVLRARGADVRLPRRPSVDQVLLFLGERYAPGFFAWAIPIESDRYRIGWGLGRPSSESQHLERLIGDYSHIFEGMEILSQTGGLIPMGSRARTSGDAGMVVGDAAGQAKPTSGGGLYTSLTCASHCARVAIAALVDGDMSATRLAEYDTAWRADIGRELMQGVAIRNAFRSLSDRDIEWGLRMLRVPGIRRMVDRHGDIDYPSRLATIALRTVPPLLNLFDRQQGPVDEIAEPILAPIQPVSE